LPGEDSALEPVIAALSGDLTTPQAISRLHEIAGALNKFTGPAKKPAMRA